MRAETIRIGQITIDFLLEASDSNGTVAIFEFTVPAAAKVPMPHSHLHYDETIYGLAGEMNFTVGNTTVRVGHGDSLFIPRGEVHGFKNLGQVDAKALAVVTPALIGPEFFREMGDIVNVGGPPNVEKLKAVMAKHGLVPAFPLGAG